MKILHKQLLALACAATVFGGATYLHAQTPYGPPAKTPEEAATNFYRLLDLVRTPTHQIPKGMDESTVVRLLGSIERTQGEALNHTSRDARDTMQFIAGQAVSQPFVARVQSSSPTQTIVTMTPTAPTQAREVVVVPEDGGYRVDVVATYGRWNNLSGLDADKSLYRETGFVSPALRTIPGYLGASTLSSCQSNEKQIMLGVIQYTQDYDERYPPARKWIDVLQPYTRSEQLFQCPALSGKGNGYAFNSKLSQASLANVMSSATTINIYETSNLGRNVYAPFNGRAYRHRRDGKDGMNIAFADGHVQWLAQGAKVSGLTIEPEKQGTGFLSISTRR